jgi:hypothetical protein
MYYIFFFFGIKKKNLIPLNKEWIIELNNITLYLLYLPVDL